MGDDSLDDIYDADRDEYAPEQSDEHDAAPTISKEQLAIKIIKQVHESLGCVLDMLESGNTAGASKCLTDLVTTKHEASRAHTGSGRVVEGVFNGEGMVGSDGKLYSVPANYASKSRLVEGDVLKLSINTSGDFVFKQIGPVERRRVVGTLAFNAAENTYVVMCEDEVYNTLTASVTYFKGEPGDEAVALVPRSGKSRWAAIENVVKK